LEVIVDCAAHVLGVTAETVRADAKLKLLGGSSLKATLDIHLRAMKATSEGRKNLRQRVASEHALAHVGRRQGSRARYIGIRKNVLDLRRTCAVENLWNKHQWVDLKADPAQLVDRYFDAHIDFANWGTHRLRVPAKRVDVKALRAYFVGDAARRG
jgi:hypothetical protein